MEATELPDDSLALCKFTTEDLERPSDAVAEGLGCADDDSLDTYTYTFTAEDWERLSQNIAEGFRWLPGDPKVETFMEHLKTGKQSHP